MKRVLFVDDEEPVLAGLRNLLRKHRNKWDLHFSVGGKAALEAMATQPFDVIVTDMRMPGMDGAELLAQVKAKFPRTARVVLSGHADQAAMARALLVAHQFLSKPCDASTLEQMLERTCALGAILGDERLRTLVGTLNTLPSPPDIYWDLTRVLGDPSSGIGDVAQIVQRDPSLTLKVLQLMNSALFGIGRPVTSIQQAVSYLGVAMIRAYALGAQVFSSLPASLAVAEAQRGAIATAHLAKSFLKDPTRADEAFTSGILHDLGKLVLIQAGPKRSLELAGPGVAANGLLHLEVEVFGATHAAVGAYVVAMWGLPMAIVEAVAHHHAPSEVGEGKWDVLAAVHVADIVGDTSWGGATGDIDVAFLERVGLADQLPRWLELANASKEAA